MKRQSKLTPKIYNTYYYPTLIIILLGLASSLYSCYSHYLIYTDIGYSSFCALTQSINCDTVAQSPWSIFLGIPMSWWGVISFTSYLFFLPSPKKNWQETASYWNILLILGLVYSIFSVTLGIISATQIHSLCIVCLTVYACHFTLTYISWLVKKRIALHKATSDGASIHKPKIPARQFALFVLGVLVAILSLKLFLPAYWLFPLAPPDQHIKHGITSNLHPWIGAEHPQLTIEEFSDYQCFQCAKMHFFLRKLIARYPDKIRLVHRNFPLDNSVNSIVTPTPFHVGSGKLAMLAIYAMSKGKFWEMNDAIYEMIRNRNKEISLSELAKKTGLNANNLARALKSKEIAELLRRDIWRGMKLGLTGTPGFVIKGKLYMGTIPSDILNQVTR